MRIRMVLCASVAALLLSAAVGQAADGWELEEGAVELKSAGPLAFGPDGILLVGDAKAATVFALDTGEAAGAPSKAQHNLENVQDKIAAVLGAKATVNDLAVNPQTGSVYLSVSQGEKPAAIVRIDPQGKLSQLSLKKIAHSKSVLPNPPEDKVTGEGRRRGNRRGESITDVAYVDGKVLVSGLSSGEAASTVRELAFPFAKADEGTSLEIFHGAHGRFEDYAPVRTFVPFNVDGEPSVLAGFTCTPLVRIPLSALTPGKKVRGTTVAELGNRNRPLDMITYEKDGKQFLLIANSARGVMKVSTENIGKQEGIEKKVSGTAGQQYETIDSLKNVVQLDRLNEKNAVVMVQAEGGALSLQTVPLP